MKCLKLLAKMNAKGKESKRKRKDDLVECRGDVWGNCLQNGNCCVEQSEAGRRLHHTRIVL